MEIKVTMPLTKTELLIPRVLCIGGKEGKKNYPESDFITGQILSLHTHGVWYIQDEKDGYNEIQKFVVDEFLNCFKPLPWWYGRTVEDMPLYLIDKFGKVKRVLRHNTDFMTVIFNDDDWEESYAHYQPADESDYQEYQKQKQ